MTPRLDPGEPGGPATVWGRTLALSLGLHLFGFALAVGLPRLLPRPASSPVYVVDLVSLPGGPANATPPAAAPAAAVKPNPPPAPKKEEKAVKIPDRTKKPEPKKTPEPKSTPAKPKPAATATPAAAPEARTEATPQAQATPTRGASMSGVTGGTGAAGGGFGGSGAAAADAMTFYYSLVQRNIENAWKKPIYPPAETSRRTYTTQIRLVLTSSGRVSSVEIVIPSGYDALDRSVLEAVHDAIFPPFPSNVSSPSLTIGYNMVLTKD